MPVAIEEASVGNLPRLTTPGGKGFRVEPISAIYSLHVAGPELQELRRIAKENGYGIQEAILRALDDYIACNGQVFMDGPGAVLAAHAQAINTGSPYP